ncbi:MAG: NADH-quinone oxidoreductase subunit N [Candidatus Acidiferrum sp.]|jgi:NADH-quinone oxidoreductase subunit N
MHFSFLDPILNYIHGDGLVVLPQMELLLFALGILIFDFLLEKREKHLNAFLALLGVAASGLGLFMQFQKYRDVRVSQMGPPVLIGFHNTAIVDGFSLVFAMIFLAATALVILLSVRYLNIEKEQEGEYYALLLFSCIGMMFMASGIDLIVLFLGLETMALSFYAMVGFLRREKRSNEAAMKYLLLGAFSTGILAYGFSLLYGMSSSTKIAEIGNILGRRFAYTSSHGITDWLAIMAFVTVAAGMFFKVAAVPFHQWAPDVYEGAPTPISAYVSVASTTASFAMLLRLMINVFGDSQTTWVYIISGVAIASLTWGNLAALTQTNIKRLLAYSSISHVGYVLLGLVAWNETGLVGIMYYLIAYAFMTIGAFAVVIVMRQRGLIGDELDDLDGLYQRSPAAALLLLIFMLSLAGIPPTAGFVGKYFIFQALIEAHHPVLAILAALYIVPALYYYFRVVVHAWMKKPGEAPAPHMSSAQAVALGAALFVTLAAGIYPEPFARLARYAFGP